MVVAEQSPNGVALAVREQDVTDLAPRMVLSLAQMRENLRQLEEFKREIMVEGVDYGVIPGTPKPTLLKPGAEKLGIAFALAPVFEPANRVEDWERGFFHYEERCVVRSKRTGEIVASASGSANSREPRHRWRTAKPACPNCGKDLFRSRNRDGEQGEPGWFCWKKEGGCGANLPSAQITAPIGRVENPEPFELANTILKMAQKRALVAAMLIATGGSGYWTQDAEDIPDERVVEASFTPLRERDEGDAPRPQTKQSKPAAPPRQAAPKPSARMVTSADDVMWERWEELKSLAEGLGVVVPPVSLPVGRQLLQSTGMQVRDAVLARQKEIEQGQVMVTSKENPAWQAWLDAEAKARKVGLPADTSVISLPIAEDALREATAQLLADVDNAEELTF